MYISWPSGEIPHTSCNIHFWYSHYTLMPNWSSCHSVDGIAGQSGAWILAGARDCLFSKTVQISLWGPPSLLFNWYRGSFPGVKCHGVKLTTIFHVELRLRKSGAIPLLLRYAFMARTGTISPSFTSNWNIPFRHVTVKPQNLALQVIIVKTRIS
jgi:hypothetical protein